ncbi:diacylglycerol/polyprenol kinase family protein [Halorussus aquaticus]|uniref:Diacylglycerol/polyprenol kinase family protein n=1 Tax=Halorussus aquaticus TaxID=2953748 RepID=A0ABD5Q771_9EURY|nr:dolichol kinase [Halorussus aquaticus]
MSLHSEVKRRLVHVSGTGYPALYLLDLASYDQLRLLLVASSVGALVLEAVRLFVGLDWRIFDELTREYEQENLAGYALYMFGMTAATLAFGPRVAIPAMLMLTIADPISGLAGSGELGVKATHTLLLTFGVCLLITSLSGLPLVTATLGALAATLADGMKPIVAGYVIDDNLTIPVGSAVVMYLTLRYLPTVSV